MKLDDVYVGLVIVLMAMIGGYALGRSHGEREQKDQARDSKLFNLGQQVRALAEQFARPDAEVPG